MLSHNRLSVHRMGHLRSHWHSPLDKRWWRHCGGLHRNTTVIWRVAWPWKGGHIRRLRCQDEMVLERPIHRPWGRSSLYSDQAVACGSRSVLDRIEVWYWHWWKDLILLGNRPQTHYFFCVFAVTNRMNQFIHRVAIDGKAASLGCLTPPQIYKRMLAKLLNSLPNIPQHARLQCSHPEGTGKTTSRRHRHALLTQSATAW